MVVNYSRHNHTCLSVHLWKAGLLAVYKVLILSLEGAESSEIFLTALVLSCCLLTGVILCLLGCSPPIKHRAYNVQYHVNNKCTFI